MIGWRKGRPARAASLALSLLVCAPVCLPAGEGRIAVGTIRWDAWHTPARGVEHGGGGGPVKAMETSLGPQAYRHRAPFFARVDREGSLRIDGYTQEIVDREIRYARDGGIDYFAFLLYDEGNSMSQGLSLYLRSGYRRDVNFCAIASPNTFGGPADWREGIGRVVGLMKQPGYQTVCGDRPLLYLFRPEEKWIAAWGGPEGARSLFDQLRAAAKSAGLGDPYLAVMHNADPAKSKKVMDLVGAQALTDYARHKNASGAPFSDLAAVARDFWERCAATGGEVVPLVMTGWDRRPRVEHPVPWEAAWQKPGEGMEKFYSAPTPDELAAHFREAIEWAEARPETCPARTVIAYAWNEHDEGGWLCPTLGENGRPDDSRLRALARMRAQMAAGDR
jgi:hypothetical protein